MSLTKELVHDGAGRTDTVITSSYDPQAEIHNSENVGLEPIWPYSLIGDDGPQHELAVRTFLHRPNKNFNDWSYDPVQAARLGLADEVKSSLLSLTEKYQTYPSGFASFVGPEFYVEQIGVVADALQKALADDYDGLIRIAPAWPKDWDADGTVYLRHGNKAHVQVRGGKTTQVELEAASADTVRVRNPWPGERVEVVDARNANIVLQPRSDAVLVFYARAATNYLVCRAGAANLSVPFETVSGLRALAPKSLGSRTIGLTK